MTGSHADCRQLVKDTMASSGCEVTVSTEPPLVASPYEQAGFKCPHGTTYWIEPTGEQISQWARDGVR